MIMMNIRMSSKNTYSYLKRLEPLKRQTLIKDARRLHESLKNSLMPIYDDYKLLVANRGEIAVRILRTAKKIGMRTVSIYTTCDALSQHVRFADEAVLLETPDGASTVSESSYYLSAGRIIEICKARQVNIVHPGYGFLSENAEFAELVIHNGIIWCGPRPDTIRLMGIKHAARKVAIDAGVDVVPGSEGLLTSQDEALKHARICSYPVMLKATAGGGGMGMVICDDEESLKRNFLATRQRANDLFNDDGLFLERYYKSARHVEVQIFGNGLGDVVHMRERECSIQRRHQKVIEETPSPFCMSQPGLAERIINTAICLARSIKYNSAGTVEFLVDDQSSQFFFLEMNTRIQVEHAITEQTHYNLDLVELMIKQSIAENSIGKGLPSGSPEMLQSTYDEMHRQSVTNGYSYSMEARIYSENPHENFIPSPGLLQRVNFTDISEPWIRVDSWVETGMSIAPYFDPLIAKIIVSASSRPEALSRMIHSLKKVILLGPPTNLSYLQDIVSSQTFTSGLANTAFLTKFTSKPRAFKVLSSGIDMSIQDLPGRTVGLGVPCSGPMDDLAFSIGNILVGNQQRGTEGLEIVVVPGVGASFHFFAPAVVAVTGKDVIAEVNGNEVPTWSRLYLPGDSNLEIHSQLSSNTSTGFRCYLSILGGFPDTPHYLGSKSTSMGLGGYQGRSLIPGDYISICRLDGSYVTTPRALLRSMIPQYPSHWDICALPGPHGDEEFLTPDGINRFYSTQWRVSHSSNRLGIRLEAPTTSHPIQWARESGGDGGAHPSNVLDNGYAPGTVNINGDTPVILTKEGPDMGGYICLCTVTTADMWKLGQISPGDTVTFQRVSWEASQQQLVVRDEWMNSVVNSLPNNGPAARTSAILFSSIDHGYENAVLHRSNRADLLIVYRQAGDRAILVEFGPMKLDILVRVRIHAFQKLIEESRQLGIATLCPCIRSILCYFDPSLISQREFLDALIEFELRVSESIENMEFPARRITFPIVLDDRWNKDALQRYMSTTRDKAVYLPSNVEYLARNNGLQGKTDALLKLIQSDFLVLGIGFYLACPFLVPIDPRCRLIGQKMNPSRTFTPRGAIGIAGPVSAIYPIESPGGYQLFGRTLPAWQTWGKGKDFEFSRPWLLQAFDQVAFMPIEEDEYLMLERDFDAGRYQFKMEAVVFSVREHIAFLHSISAEVEAFTQLQEQASRRETSKENALLLEWEETKAKASAAHTQTQATSSATPSIGQNVTCPLFSTVWKIKCQVGDIVKSDTQVLFVLEAMKTEISVVSGKGSIGRTVMRLGGDVMEGGLVRPGHVLAILS